MTSDATIAALLTPLAPGAIAVVGLMGPRTDEILRQILRTQRDDSPFVLKDRRPTFCRIVEEGRTLDDAVAVRLDSAGRVLAELNTHGGVRVVQRLLLLLEKHGARVVDGMTFHEIVHPVSPIERDVNRALLKSGSRRMTQWLLGQRELLPAYIERWDTLDREECEAFFVRSEAAIRLVRGIEIAIVGPPNAGKSTLANRLIGDERVLTSDIPGTTRDWISETAMIDGWPVTLTDTAGVRSTDCAIEAEAIVRGRGRAHEADLILVVVDAAQSLEVFEKQWSEICATLPTERPLIVVRNKCDKACAEKISSVDSKSTAEGGWATTCCSVSALTGEGVELLESRIAAALGLDLIKVGLPTAFLAAQIALLS